MNSLDTPAPVSLQKNTQYPPLDQDNPFSPKGRFTRLSYLAWNAVIGLIFSFALFMICILGFGGVALANLSGYENIFTHPLVIIAIILAVVTYIALIVAMVCIMIRRLHDLNKSGWLWLVMLIPFVSIFFSLYIFIARGSKETNNYGPFRPTEVAEKYIGIAYATFISIFLVLYVIFFSFVMAKPEAFIEALTKSESVLTTQADNESSTDENTSEESEINSDQEEADEHVTIPSTDTQRTREHIENASEQAKTASDEANAAAEAAVKAANDAVKNATDEANR